jgi:hypothetical protein
LIGTGNSSSVKTRVVISIHTVDQDTDADAQPVPATFQDSARVCVLDSVRTQTYKLINIECVRDCARSAVR